MSEEKRTPRMNWTAALWFGVAVAGIPLGVYLFWNEPTTPFGHVYLLAAFPTTQLGIWGGIGAIYDQLRVGIIIGVLLCFALWYVGIILSIGGAI